MSLYQFENSILSFQLRIHRIRKVKFPSLWYFRVTSIALRALHFTLETFWAELLYVPQDTVNRLALWLWKKQYLEGYWVEESIIYDRNMKVLNGYRKHFICKHWIILLTSGGHHQRPVPTCLLEGPNLRRYWHLVATKACAVGKRAVRILPECVLVNYSYRSRCMVPFSPLPRFSPGIQLWITIHILLVFLKSKNVLDISSSLIP